MKPLTLLLLLGAALGVSVAVRVRTSNLSGSTESRRAENHQLKVAPPMEPGRSISSKDRLAAKRLDGTRLSGSHAPPAQSLTPEAQRIIGEIMAEGGLTEEEATLHYRHGMDWATTQRIIRAPMPGVRTNVDLRRFPLFEP